MRGSNLDQGPALSQHPLGLGPRAVTTLPRTRLAALAQQPLSPGHASINTEVLLCHPHHVITTHTQVGQYEAFRCRGPAGTLGPFKALDQACKAGFRDGLKAAQLKGGGQAGIECRSSWGTKRRDILGYQETVAAGKVGEGGFSLLEGSTECLKD